MSTHIPQAKAAVQGVQGRRTSHWRQWSSQRGPRPNLHIRTWRFRSIWKQLSNFSTKLKSFSRKNIAFGGSLTWRSGWWWLWWWRWLQAVYVFSWLPGCRWGTLRSTKFVEEWHHPWPLQSCTTNCHISAKVGRFKAENQNNTTNMILYDLIW